KKTTESLTKHVKKLTVTNDKDGESHSDYQFITDLSQNYKSLFAIPVLGSCESQSDWKFSCRLVPGKNKKGKLIKEIVTRFLQIADLNEKEIIEKISDTEWLNAVISESRLGK
ncbi:putative RNA-binding protein, partial [Pseudoloma neurophilia]